MKNIITVCAFTMLFLALTGCTTRSAGKAFEFNSGKKYALVAYDIYFVADTWPNYALYLFPYDQKTKTIKTSQAIKTGSGLMSKRNNAGVEFYLGTADPGTYVTAFLFYQTQGKKTILCFPEQALFVEIEKGKIHYIGEFTFSLDHPEGVNSVKLETIPHDLQHVRSRLSKYPKVGGEIVITPPSYVTFDPGTPTRENACVTDYTS